jgi:two-component system NtrC family sensor kinase
MDPAQQEPLLKELFHHYTQLARLSTFDLSGARLTSSHPGGAPSIAARQSFQTAARRGHQAWEVAVALSTGRASLLIHTPIRDAQRQVLGVLGAVIDLENLSAVVGKVPVGAGGRVFVLDAQGHVLLHPEQAVVQERRDYSWMGVPTGGRPAGPATVRYQIADEALVAGYAPVPTINWTVVVERPEREILAPARQSWHLAIAGLGTSTALALLTAIILARMLTRPVHLLATAAQALASGDAGVPLSAITSKVDELHTLMEAFTTMRQAVIRREEALRESEGRKGAILEGALDAIITIDHEGRIVEFNPAAEQVFGYSRETVVGQRMADLIIPPSIRDVHYEGFARYLATGESVILGQRLEMMGVRADGTEIPVELSVIRVGDEEPPLFTAFLRDISSRKRAEETLQRQQETLYQSEKLAAMGALLAGVAHELNNPLAVVLGQAELLRQQTEGSPLAARAARISRASERCARIVKNFLALARQHPPERQTVRLNPIVREAVELLAYPLRVDDVEVVCNLADDLPPLWADPNQLHQVVVNLLTNARDALHTAPPPRRLTLTTGLDALRQHLMLEVADTGPGIPPELQGRIFEPFYTTKPVGQGTGLGLSLCYGIIQEHGGTLQVESAPGQGARFIIELPAEYPAETHPEPQSQEIRSHDPGKRILVVDDEPEVAAILADILAIDGHQVDTAGNGARALACLQAGAYDLILSDLRMPELDGPGLYRELERSHPTLLRRMLFLTGDTLSPELQAFVEQTGARTVNKPFTVAEVRRVVRQVLEDVARELEPVTEMAPSIVSQSLSTFRISPGV